MNATAGVNAPGPAGLRATGGDARLERLAASRAKGVEIAQQFEQVFVQQMVEKMRQTVDINGDGEGLFAKGPGSDTYAMWFDRLLGERVQAESQIGVADRIVEQLEDNREIPRLDELRDRMEAARSALPGNLGTGRLEDVLA